MPIKRLTSSRGVLRCFSDFVRWVQSEAGKHQALQLFFEFEAGGLLPSARICADEDINFKMSVDRLILNVGWELRSQQAKERERKNKNN